VELGELATLRKPAISVFGGFRCSHSIAAPSQPPTHVKAMCGIHVVVSHNSSFDTTTPPAHLKQGLINRGPDYFGQVTTRLEAATAPVFLTFTSTVLALRGDHVTKQPFQDAQTGSVLCWNGEAWRINGQPVEGNDGEAIFALLSVASKKSSETRSRDPILDVFRSIQAITGPFAFVYFDGPSETVYFGRDRLGRRSLLICRDESNGSFVLSSMAEACQATWMEVNSDGVYSVVLRQDADSKHIPLPVRHYWLPPVSSEFVSEVETDEEYVSWTSVRKPVLVRPSTHIFRCWGWLDSTVAYHVKTLLRYVVNRRQCILYTDYYLRV
jgi:asparagine synthetase B (glutamine-hydrolysing)